MMVGHDGGQTGSTADGALAALRERLDHIDRKLLDVLRDRLACCVDIAHLKRRNAIPMMQPHRIGLVQNRAAEYGREHDIDQDFLRRLYDLVISETCRLENIVIGIDAPTGSAA